MSWNIRVYDYYVGIDLGQRSDYSALAIIEEPAWLSPFVAKHFEVSEGWVAPSALHIEQLEYARREAILHGRPPRPPLAVPHLQRWPLGTPYTQIVTDVLGLLRSSQLRPFEVMTVVDATGVGRGVVDMFVNAGIDLRAVTITGGHDVHVNGTDLSVPKVDLVSTVAVLLENRRLAITPALPESQLLSNELQNFRMKQRPDTGHESFESWRESDHDDLVLSVALAAWFREWWSSHLEHHFAVEEERNRQQRPLNRVQRALQRSGNRR